MTSYEIKEKIKYLGRNYRYAHFTTQKGQYCIADINSITFPYEDVLMCKLVGDNKFKVLVTTDIIVFEFSNSDTVEA